MVQVKQYPPVAIEREYQKLQIEILNNTKRILEDEVLRYLPMLLGQDTRIDSTDRMDDIASKIAALFMIANGKVDAYLALYGVQKAVQNIAELINRFNTKQFQRVVKTKIGIYTLRARPGLYKSAKLNLISKAEAGLGGINIPGPSRESKLNVFKLLQNSVGIDTFADNPALKDTMNLWVVNNVNLIKSVNKDFLAQSEQILYDGATRGQRHEVIAKRILADPKIVKTGELEKSAFKKAKTRAKIIARDQTNKLNGQLNRMRQQDCGIEDYDWRGVMDSRERHSHVRLEGQRCSWEVGAPSLNGANPGDEILCRCYGDPVIDLDAILGDAS